MALPPLYVQNLTVQSGDPARLNAYKLGLVEHVLKEALRLVGDGQPVGTVQERVRTALEVVLWEPRADRGPT